MAQQKVVLKILAMNDEKTKQKAIEAVAEIYGDTCLLLSPFKKFLVCVYLGMHHFRQGNFLKKRVHYCIRSNQMEPLLAGIDSIAADLKEQKMTIIGEMDPVAIAKKLKKIGKIDIISVGPAKEEKKEEKKDDKK